MSVTALAKALLDDEANDPLEVFAEVFGEDDEQIQPYATLSAEEALKGTDIQVESLPFTLYQHHRIKVDPGQLLMRLDIFLSNRLSKFSRSRIKTAASYGLVRVNDARTKVSYKVRPGDEISIILPYPQAPETQPEQMSLDIVYEDPHLLVLNKPAGLVCHPGTGNYRGTLLNGLIWHCRFNPAKSPEEQASVRPSLVHRIDKDTSGLLLIAKHEEAYHPLAAQFANRTTSREYLALVWGDVKGDAGTIDEPIGRSPSDRKKFQVVHDETGKLSITHYRVVQRFGFMTLVRCKLQTGRTHQIRVHFKYIGHTLFNDEYYGGDRMLISRPSTSYRRFIEDMLRVMPRQALHARTLGFTHSHSGMRMDFSAPLPNDFTLMLHGLSRYVDEPLNPELELSPMGPEEEKSLLLGS